MNSINQDVAGRLAEAARLLRDQGADRYRVGAYEGTRALRLLGRLKVEFGRAPVHGQDVARVKWR